MTSQLNASLLRLKVLDALRSGDTAKADTVINQLNSTKPTIQATDILLLKETILHYAVQVAPLSLIQHLVAHGDKYNLDINAQDLAGNTPLHLAALSNRLEVIKYLLSLPNINDTVVNLDKKQPVELSKDLEVAQLMQFERAKFVEKLATQLRDYFTKRDFDNLEKLLVSNPRAAELLDINGADPETGNTVLHEFILKNDLTMCDWILKHGGDPFKRDKRGKLPIDLISNKSDPIRKLLKAASKDQTIMDPVAPVGGSKLGAAPTYRGYLKKWTNFASGYKLRYFVLDEKGILSYYTNQDDTNNACRGSLNLSFAQLHLDSSEKLKFEIIGKNDIRWHLKANHPIETNRWVWNLQNAITIAKDNMKQRVSSLGSNSNSKDASNEENPRSPTSLNSNKASFDGNDQQSTDGGKKHHLLSLKRLHRRTGSQVSLSSVGSNEEEISSNPPSRSGTMRKTSESPNLAKIKEGASLKPEATASASAAADQGSYLDTDNENFDYDLEDMGTGDYDSDTDSVMKSVADSNSVQDQISTVKGSLEVEISSVLDLFSNVLKSPDSLDLEICKVAHNTLNVIQDLFNKYNSLLVTKDHKNHKKLERQLEVNKLWENSIRQLEKEIANREQKLAEYDGKKKQLKKYLTSKSSGSTTPNAVASGVSKSAIAGAAGTLPLNPSHDDEQKTRMLNKELATGSSSDPVLEEILNDSDDEFFDADEYELTESSKSNENLLATKASQSNLSSQAPEEEAKDSETLTSDVDPNQKMEHTEHEHPSNGTLNENQEQKQIIIDEEGSYLGYENPPRNRLPLDEDDRPKVGLWGILKSMIGKDMTRMTLPVSFNECTSLLQRLAEDVEYSDLLDQAATFEDSALRTAYVSTFAASEYASTINRIAKPFNPLLGETFEYCRPDKNYRLITEQVSHHPPISACRAESAKWDYYGENAVDSQFKGRSFDFKHLGKMFCVIRPDKGVIDVNGKLVKEEVYSWKKVNTSVVGIIVGNPTVDNYGKMEVTNHTTGDKIVVDLKQRGWRASSAYQLSGTVFDKTGKGCWAIGGHWNSKIYGKKLNPNRPAEADRRASLVDNADRANVSKDPFQGGPFLVWQAAPRPKVPFNLTSFAITLNGIDDNLKKYLAPSDTRLRPDQRAMEDGKYDLAADEKHRVEEKQRAARREREAKKQTYKPNWFIKTKHPVTGDNYWEYNGEYWKARKNHQLDGCADIF